MGASWHARGASTERGTSEGGATSERFRPSAVSRGGRVGTLAVSRGGFSRQPWRSGRVGWLCSARGGRLAPLAVPSLRRAAFFSACLRPVCRWRCHRWRFRFASPSGRFALPPAVPPPAAKRGFGHSREKKPPAFRFGHLPATASQPPRAEQSQPTRPDRHG